MSSGPADGILQALARSGGTMVDSATEISYHEIAAAVHQVAAILDGQGIAAADCVAFACGNDVPSAIVLLALLATGRTFILLPPAAPAIDPGVDAAVPETFCRYRLQVRGRQETAAVIVPALADTSVVISENPCWRANLPAGPACFFVPTSGSTARAKLVRHRHGRLLRAAASCAERLDLVPADRIALPVPIVHMFGLGAAFLPGLLAGASIDIQSNANALRYLARERHFGPTVAFLTPGFGDAIVRLRKTPRQYRLTVMAGDRLTADLFDRYERLHGCLVNLYGSTELGVIAAGDPADRAPLRRDVVGRLMPGAAIRRAADRAASPEDGAEMLWFRHDDGFECYTDADGRAIVEPDGSLASRDCFRSNDVGRLVDGYLSVHGRADDLVNRDGILVACGDVADAVRSVRGMADAVILCGAMSRRGRALIAFCVTATGNHWDIGALRKACLDVLPPRAIPDEFVFLPDLPRLPGGKVDRMALRHRYILEETGTEKTGTEKTGTEKTGTDVDIR